METKINPATPDVVPVRSGNYRNDKTANKWLVLFASAVGCLILTFIVFLALDLVFNPTVATAAPVSDDNYPHLAADLPQKIDIALNNANADTPSGLALFFDNKLTTTAAGSLPGQSVLPTNGLNSISLPKGLSSQQIARSPSVPYPANPAPLSVNQVSPLSIQPSPVISSTENAQNRLSERQKATRNGGVMAPVSEVYDIEDVTPVGVVGDSRTREVLFYSPVTKQTFSAPLGAKFRNGTLEGASQSGNVVDGVRFKRESSGEQITRLWSKGKNKDIQTTDTPVLSDQPVMTPQRPTVPQSARRNY